jgi:hypothetical protein
MANDWIKMRCMLDTDPAVYEMAATLGIGELDVVGRLWKVWSWADQHSVDGNAVRVTGVTLDRLTATPGFTSAMREVGWLEGEDHALTFPNFARHNGQTAKNRGLTAMRVAKHRNGAVTDESLPEKRRIEKKEAHTQQGAVKTPAVEEVIEAGKLIGIEEEICRKWFDECEANPFTFDGGWTRIRGGEAVPMNMDRWRNALSAYAVGWRSRKAIASSGASGGTSSAPSVWSLKQKIEAAQAELNRIRSNPENKEQVPGSWDRRLKPEPAAQAKELKAKIDGWRAQMTEGKEAA